MTDHADIIDEAVREYVYRARLPSKAALARKIGVDRRTLNNYMAARATSRRIAAALAELRLEDHPDLVIPACPECGRATCPGCS